MTITRKPACNINEKGEFMSIRSQRNDGPGGLWALVLAAGEGSRLRTLTTTETGLAVPKQFCSLRGEHSLLDETILRAQSIVSTERICVIVAAHHHQWWDRYQGPLPLVPDNIIVQPRNRERNPPAPAAHSGSRSRRAHRHPAFGPPCSG